MGDVLIFALLAMAGLIGLGVVGYLAWVVVEFGKFWLEENIKHGGDKDG